MGLYIKCIYAKLFSYKSIFILIIVLNGFQSIRLNAQFKVLQTEQGTTTLSKIENQNIPGGDYKNFEIKPGENCQTCIDSCLKDPKCKGYTFVKPYVMGPNGKCWLKSAIGSYINDVNCISGIKTFQQNDRLKQLFPTYISSFQGIFFQNNFLSYPKGNIDNSSDGWALAEAVQYCRNITDKGFSDWRVPTYEELVEYIRYFPLRFLDSMKLSGPYGNYLFITKTPYELGLNWGDHEYEIVPIITDNQEFKGRYSLKIGTNETKFGHYLIDLNLGNPIGNRDQKIEEFTNNIGSGYSTKYYGQVIKYPKVNCICIRGK